MPEALQIPIFSPLKLKHTTSQQFSSFDIIMAETPGMMYALAIVLTILAFLATALRFYARYIKKAGFSWDDYMILPAMLFTISTAIGMIVGEQRSLAQCEFGSLTLMIRLCQRRPSTAHAYEGRWLSTLQ